MFRRGALARLILGIGLALTAAASAQNATEVAFEKPISRSLSHDEEHSYRIELAPGQLARLELRKDGGDLQFLHATEAEGEPCVWQSPTGSNGAEALWLFAESPAETTHFVTVRSLAGERAVSTYEMTLRASDRREGIRAVKFAQRSLCAAFAWLKGRDKTNTSGDVHVQRLINAASDLRASGRDDALRSFLLVYAGRLLAKLDQFGEAATRLREADAVQVQLGLDHARAITAYELGKWLAEQGELEEALGHQLRGVELAERSRDLSTWALASNSAGATLSDLGRSDEALEYYRGALEALERLGETYNSTAALSNIGVELDNTGRSHEALSYLERALEALGEHRNSMYATLLNNLGSVADKTGDKQSALDYYRQALQLLDALGDRSGAAWVRLNLAVTLSSLGDKLGAVAAYDESLATARDLGLRRLESWAASNRGHVLKELGRLSEAREALEAARLLRQDIGDRRGEAYTVTSLAEVSLADGDRARAIQLLEEGLELWRAVKDQRGEVGALLTLTEIEIERGETERGDSRIQAAIELAAQSGDPLNEARALEVRAKLETATGHLTAAVDSLTEVVDQIESVRLRVAGEGNRARFLSTKQMYYDRLVSLRLELAKQAPSNRARHDHLAAAFQMSDRGRARSTIDRLFGATPDIETRIDADLLSERRRLVGQLPSLDRKRRSAAADGDSKQVGVLDREIRALLAEIRHVSGQMRARDPAYGALTEPPAVSVSEIQSVLEPGELFLEYAFLEDQAVVFSITTETFRVSELGPSTDLLDQVTELVDILPRSYERRLRVRYETLAEALGEKLLGSVLVELGEAVRVYVVPEAGLHYLPFAALRVSREGEISALIERQEVVMVPSASVFAGSRSRPTPQAWSKRLAVFGDPVFARDDPRVLSPPGNEAPAAPSPTTRLTRSMTDFSLDHLPRLEWTRKEVEALAALTQVDDLLVRVDFDASLPSALDSSLRNYDYLHFATHGFFNDVHPDLSGIVLSLLDRDGDSTNGFLTAPQIFDLRLDARLAVLSGCQTALGREVAGEGILGLVRALQFSGARSVIASLWNVDDAATVKLMQVLYKHLLEDGLEPPEALRRAQVSVMQDPATAAPYYWAAFVLHGT